MALYMLCIFDSSLCIWQFEFIVLFVYMVVCILCIYGSFMNCLCMAVSMYVLCINVSLYIYIYTHGSLYCNVFINGS